MGKPHILVIPFPAQGHVNPLMNFSRQLAKHGFKITFANTEFIHKRIVQSLPAAANNSNNNDSNVLDEQIRLVSMSDELGPEEYTADQLVKLSQAILRDMPAKLEELISNINTFEGDDGKITCIILDAHVGWALEVAEKMGIRGAIMWPISAMTFALNISIPRLIDEGIIDGSTGMTIKRQMYQLSSSMPVIDTTNFLWSCFHNLETNKTVFEYFRKYNEVFNIAEWWVCNTIYELEPATFSLLPKLKPIGLLMADHNIGNAGAQFWRQDSTCLNWLNQQPTRSVVYVAFGSLVMLNKIQFDELAHGLGLSNRPFLWVDRAGLMDGPGNAYPNGFPGSKGKIVGWAPQQKVLSHPAIACFISHCGWNSTMEGVSNGVPFLCWPCLADQFLNQDYICDIWKVGLRFDQDKNGVITRWEIKKNVEILLGDESIRARSLELKEMVSLNIAEGGRSTKNFSDFIEWLNA